MRRREEQPPMVLIPRELEASVTGMTIYEIARAMGLHLRNTSEYIKLLRERGTVRICGWTTNGVNAPMPVYGLGSRDVRKPGRGTQIEAQRKYYSRNKTLINLKKRCRRSGGATKASPMDVILNANGA